MTINEMRQKVGELTTAQRAILDAAERRAPEQRALTADESQAYDRMDQEASDLLAEIGKAELAERRSASLAAREADIRKLTSGGIRPDVGARPAAAAADLEELDPEVRDRMQALGTPEYRRAFVKQLVHGRAALSADERRALSVGTGSEGGYTVPTEEFRPLLIKAVDNQAVIRTIANVLPPVAQATTLGAPTLSADPADADWTTELATGSEDSTMAFGKRELQPYPVAKRIKVSKKLLRASPLGMATFVPQRLGYKLGVTQSKAFNTGNGSSQPLGIFTASAQGISTGRDVEIGNGSGAIADAKLIDARYTLREGYVGPNTYWVMHRLWFSKIRQLKATTGDYLWMPGLARGNPAAMLLLDVPVVLDEYSPSTTTHGAGVYAAVLGDFSFYWVVDALGMEVQRLDELYSETNQVGFIIRGETDGMPVLEDAFVRCIAAT